MASHDAPEEYDRGKTWSAPRIVAAKFSAPRTTSSIIEQPSSAKAQARMAGQASCWQAEIISMAMHSSRQKRSQSTGAVSRAGRGWRLQEGDEQARTVKEALEARGP